MSSPLFSAPMGSLVAFAPRSALRNDAAMVLKRLAALPKLAGVAPASRLEVRSPAEMVSSGIGEIDELTGGLPRGCLSQICGAASSGRTSVLLAALAAATRREEVCALVDTTDALDAVSAAAAGVDLERLLWVRCAGRRTSDFGRQPSDFGLQTSDSDPEIPHPETPDPSTPHQRSGARYSRAQNPTPDARRAKSHFRHLEQALRVTDLLLQSGGFGMVAIDLGDVPHAAARRMPLASWFRFQRTIEPTPTVLLVVVQEPCAQTCASLLIRLQSGKRLSALSDQLSVNSELWPAHAQLLDGLQIEGELLRSRLQRKPSQSVTTAFATNPVRIA
jgi:recombination protein RecA